MLSTSLIGPVKIGTDCNVTTNTLIGQRTDGRSAGVPTIGDRVWIGANPVAFGNIAIGSGSDRRSAHGGWTQRSNAQPRAMYVMRSDYDSTHQGYANSQFWLEMSN